MDKDKKELYTSPEVKVLEIKARQVICTSPGGGLGASEWDNTGSWE